MDWVKAINWEYAVLGFGLVAGLGVLIVLKNGLKFVIRPFCYLSVTGILLYGIITCWPNIVSTGKVRVTELWDNVAGKEVLCLQDTLKENNILNEIVAKAKKALGV